MKTKEFIEKVEAMGYKTNTNGSSVFVVNNESKTVIRIGSGHRFIIDVHYNHLPDENIFNLAVEYAKTPITERESVKKYRVKVLPSNKGYLNIDLGLGEQDGCFISDGGDFGEFKTGFTVEEINDLKGRQDLAIDWDKAILERTKG